MKNPVKEARQDLGLSLYDLSNMTGLTKTTILRVEAGQPDHIPSPIQSTLELTQSDLNAYSAFRAWKRSIHSLNPLPTYLHYPMYFPHVNPFMKWLEVSRRSINSFANDFCLPYSLVQNFCQHPEQFPKPPHQLVDALMDSKTRMDDIESFLVFYETYFEVLRGGAVGSLGTGSLKEVAL